MLFFSYENICVYGRQCCILYPKRRGVERLEAKKINGQTYYYYSVWSWVNGKCRRTFQRYLGKPTDIYNATQQAFSPQYAEIFDFGLPMAIWNELKRQRVVEIIDQLCPKREQGISIGEYLGIAAVNRAIEPASKMGMWEWFQRTALHRVLPGANRTTLTSQRFWDHMDAIPMESIQKIWETIITTSLKQESVGLDDICYDGTNFYTFIDTFNTACDLPKRGKNKQGRCNLRQVSYALFCTAAEQIPLCFDIYPGNRNDCPEFSVMVQRFKDFLIRVGLPVSNETSIPVTLIFDKGNNSAENINLMDQNNLHFIGSVKLDEHKELAAISNKDPQFATCVDTQLPGMRFIKLEKEIYGKSRTVLVCYNPRLFEQQWMTINHDIAKAVEGLSAVRSKLEDRANGLITRGKAPTIDSIRKQVNSLLNRPFLHDIIIANITDKSTPTLDYTIDTKKLESIADTYLGKKIVITTRSDWDAERIIKAYHSQYAIEHVFRNMKDRTTGVWWPMHHWTNQKIYLHGFYCTIAMLLRSIICRRVRIAKTKIPYRRIFSELAEIREVISVFKKSRKGENRTTVLTKLNEVQGQLLDVLAIPRTPQETIPV
jgi:transposase